MIVQRGRFAGLLAVALLLSACASNGPEGPPSEKPTGGPGVQGTVYLNETELLIMESYPIQLALRVRGDLPTPCHELRWEAEEPDEEGNIYVDLNSVAPVGQDCVQVLEPFEETLDLGTVQGGTFTIYVNGEEVGSVDA